MPSKRTYKLAIEVMQKEIQRIAFDANLYDLGFADFPSAENRSKRRRELLKAIEEITLELMR